MSAPEPFGVEIARAGDERAVVARGELDMASAGELAAALERACATHGRVVVDLSGVTFVDSSGLQVLVAARHHADGNGCAMRVGAASEVVERLLELTQTAEFLRRP